MAVLSPYGRGGRFRRLLRDNKIQVCIVTAVFLLCIAYSRAGDDLPGSIGSLRIGSHTRYSYSLSDGLSLTEQQHVVDRSHQRAWGKTKEEKPNGPLIPKKIWQNMFSHNIDPIELQHAPTWLAKNPDYDYKLVGLTGADEILDKYYSDREDITSTFRGLRNIGIRSDLLRYMLLFNEGGVYTDIDTVAIKPISKWVPKEYKDTVRVIIGVEFDELAGGAWRDVHDDLQFCQWTIAAAPGHRLFANMVDHGIRRVHEIAAEQNSTLGDLEPWTKDVLTSTGPTAWTDVIWAELQKIDPELKSLRDLSLLKGPRVIGDIMILPVDSFGMGQPHSKSTYDGSIPEAALARHLFRGSWRIKYHPDKCKGGRC